MHFIPLTFYVDTRKRIYLGFLVDTHLQSVKRAIKNLRKLVKMHGLIFLIDIEKIVK
jgi:hypothetical protein